MQLFVVGTHRSEDMTVFVLRGRARGSVRDRDEVTEHKDDGLGVEARKREVQDGRYGQARVAGHSGIQFSEGAEQTGSDVLATSPTRVGVRDGEFGGETETGNQMNRLRTGTEA